MVIGLMWNIGGVRLFHSSPLMSVTVMWALLKPFVAVRPRLKLPGFLVDLIFKKNYEAGIVVHSRDTSSLAER